MITMTDKAVEKIKEISESEGLENQYVRIKVKGGGCSGMMHDMEFTIQKGDLDEEIEFDGVKIIIDPVSFQYLENVNIDYVDALIGGGFKFTSPDILTSCGCGKSVSY